MYRSLIKPVVDFLISAIAFAMLSPVFIFITIALYIANNGKPFFFQQRPGLKGKLFTIAKFKTMNDRRNKYGELLPDAERLTALGKFVRKTSIDEIPQLLNVIAGDMSIVGPRPLLPEYLKLYSPRQARRHEVRPGITGWAQVNGRNAISWEEKFDYDVYYVDHQSFALDLKILIKTVRRIFKTDDINAAGAATMEKFTGSSFPKRDKGLI